LLLAEMEWRVGGWRRSSLTQGGDGELAGIDAKVDVGLPGCTYFITCPAGMGVKIRPNVGKKTNDGWCIVVG
jgi:hypothetical protein